jgi:hypothetical protein
MTAAAASSPSEPPADPGGTAPAGWAELRRDPDIQFTPIEIPELPPPEPTWFQRLLSEIFELLAELLGPVGQAFVGAWWWLKWALLAIVVIAALVLLVRLIAPTLGRRGAGGAKAGAAADEWAPDRAASLALLEDADRLAAEGRFDEATHLLLQRSVSQIAAARPDWVEPSSTARELAALPALPVAARNAFGVIAARVEASLFALRALDRADWDAARAAYAEFALARLDRQGQPA